MLYAISDDQEKILAEKGRRGSCPFCQRRVVAKCGQINIHHWAHEINSDCPASGLETEWHLNWKSRFSSKYVEHRFGKFIADVYLPKITVIEFQNSSISVEDVLARNAFYRNPIWIVNGMDFEERFSIRNRGEYLSFRFKHRRKTISRMMPNLYIDFGTHLFRVKKEYDEMRSGWGVKISYLDFFNKFGDCYISDSFLKVLEAEKEDIQISESMRLACKIYFPEMAKP